MTEAAGRSGLGSFVRGCGWALMAGGVLFGLINSLLTPFLPTGAGDEAVRMSWAYVPRMAGAMVCGLLLILGSLGVHLAQRHALGRFGATAWGLAFVGSVLLVAVEWSNLFVFRALAEQMPGALEPLDKAVLLNVGFGVSVGLFSLGWLLLAVAVLRARVLPRWAAVATLAGLVLIPMLGGPLGVPGMVAGNVVFGAGLWGLGRGVVRESA